LYQQQIEDKSLIIVGVNKFQTKEEGEIPSFKIDDSIRDMQCRKIEAVKNNRNQSDVDKNLADLENACGSGENLMPKILNAVENYATLGEISDSMRKCFGEYAII
jgi:methylmalonyl-CoA mutase N-terminal domain/subunit